MTVKENGGLVEEDGGTALDVGEQQTGNAKSQRKSFEPKSDLDEQRKSVSAGGEVAAAVTRPLRQRYSVQVLRRRWRKCFKVCGPDRRGNPYH